MNFKFVVLVFAFGLLCQPMFGQQADRIQRGQRNYTPPPTEGRGTYIETKDPIEETNLIMGKCEVLGLDDFQKEIMKGMLKKKIEDDNAILMDKANSRDDRRKKLDDRHKAYIKELSGILSKEQVDQYLVMDFTETKEEKKEKKKKKKNRRDKKN